MVSRDEYFTFPERFDRLIPPPCVVRILLVMDDQTSFADLDFGLKELVDTLAVSPGPWVRFEVTKAHRECDRSPLLKPGVDYIPHFKFSDAALSGIDEVWLFGVATATAKGPEMEEAQLAALARFMDGGGGVFATGDHEDLGNRLCARVPRVRVMRKWYWPNPGPFNEPIAPVGRATRDHHTIFETMWRLDTLREGHDPDYQFDDQSDTVPQKIEPKIYTNHSLRPGSYPHPLLCGPRGPITVLPDHGHEGQCYVTKDLDRTLSFENYSTVEFPQFEGTWLKPEVIAWATVIGGHKTLKAPSEPGEPNFPEVIGRRFGVIGAWEGHLVNRGRVVVDASFHHFFQVNLRGVNKEAPHTNTIPEKLQGFHFNAEGLAVLEDIKSYYRNIGFWLARPEQQLCMLHRALWWARWEYPLLEELLPPVGRDFHTARYFGGVAREILRRAGARYLVDAWAIRLFSSLATTPLMRQLLSAVDPWHPRARVAAQTEVPPALDTEQLFDLLLGGAMIEIGDAFPPEFETDSLAAQARLKDLVHRGVENGWSMMLDSITSSLTETQRFFVKFEAQKSQTPVAGFKEDEMASPCVGARPWSIDLTFDDNPQKEEGGSLTLEDGPGTTLRGTYFNSATGKEFQVDGKCKSSGGERVMTVHFIEDGRDYFLRAPLDSGDKITRGVFVTSMTRVVDRERGEILSEPGDTGTWQGSQGPTVREEQEQQQRQRQQQYK